MSRAVSPQMALADGPVEGSNAPVLIRKTDNEIDWLKSAHDAMSQQLANVCAEIQQRDNQWKDVGRMCKSMSSKKEETATPQIRWPEI